MRSRGASARNKRPSRAKPFRSARRAMQRKLLTENKSAVTLTLDISNRLPITSSTSPSPGSAWPFCGVIRAPFRNEGNLIYDRNGSRRGSPKSALKQSQAMRSYISRIYRRRSEAEREARKIEGDLRAETLH